MNFTFGFFPDGMVSDIIQIIAPKWGDINHVSFGPFN